MCGCGWFGTVESSVTNRVCGGNAKWFAKSEQSDLLFVPLSGRTERVNPVDTVLISAFSRI
ncbi:hypothetical protein PTKU64_90870 (plasmid) [Paraburkholderia terrae]|uniref:Uncharacterized protein n=1 Tax=Paraburkholderia terrae TaxID=311230 RepID=A0ABM7U2A8_9BURK|nr:hypothetical protein PTKU64_90870 [Paraburkholderia terrae]